MTRAAPPQWSFADLEFLAQKVTLDPLLQQISGVIDQHQTLLVEHVRQDLQRGLINPATGDNGLDALPRKTPARHPWSRRRSKRGAVPHGIARRWEFVELLQNPVFQRHSVLRAPLWAATYATPRIPGVRIAAAICSLWRSARGTVGMSNRCRDLNIITLHFCFTLTKNSVIPK